MNTFLRRSTMLILALAAGLYFCAGPASTAGAETIKLKIQSALPVTSNYYVEMEKCLKDINDRTGGEVLMTIFPPGALVKPLEILDAVKRGSVEGALSTGAYAVKKMPEGLIEHSIPISFTGERFTMEAANQYYEFFYTWRGGEVFKTFQDLYAKLDIYLVGESVASSYGFMTTFPVNRLSDLKGKKFRCFGLYSVMVQSLGASPTSISNSEQYMALQRRTVDGTVYTYSALDTYNLNEVITNVVFPPALHTPAVNMIINMKVWEKLSPKNQEIITKTYREHAEKFSHIALDDEKRAIDDAEKSGKIKLTTLPPEDIQEFKDAGRKSWAVAAKKSETSAKLIELLTEYLKEKGVY